MKYYVDTEFHEYKKEPTLLGLKVGKPIDTIELISIGIVAEDNREYYAICNEFDIKEAWSKWQPKQQRVSDTNSIRVKEYWLRENVLKPIWKELQILDKEKDPIVFAHSFTLQSMKLLLKRYGKTRAQIAEEVKAYVNHSFIGLKFEDEVISKPEFYAYYTDYDWVVFCWLFGRMIDLPEGFPMYCKDLKQTLSDKQLSIVGDRVELVKAKNYPKQTNEHNALADAKWNKRLHEFINHI